MSNTNTEKPIGEFFCNGSIHNGSGCNRCGSCAIELAKRVQELEAREPAYIWTGTEADDAMILLGRMDDSLDPERIAQLEQIVPRLAARIRMLESQQASSPRH